MGSTENGKAEPEGDGILSRREAAHEVARAALRDVMERRRLTRQQVADVLIVSLPTVHSWLLPARSGASRTMAPDRLEALQEATAHLGDIPTWPTGDGAHEARRVLLRNLMEERGLGKQGVADALGTSVHTVRAWLLPSHSAAARVIPENKFRALEAATVAADPADTPAEDYEHESPSP